ncbi:MAG: DUF1819 family protein [Proteobacteria bacterium]|nr:DUF1819 family protein [Pseudomonadota bacterium]
MSLIEGDTVSAAGRSGRRGNGGLPVSPAFTFPATREGQPYVSRLASRAAFYAELHSLLAAVEGAVPRAEYRRRVIEDNVLSRRTAAAREKTWKELAARYGIDGASPLFRAFLEEYRRASSENDRALTAYLLFALHDRLVCDLGTEWIYQYLRTAPGDLRTADVLAFLRSRERSHPEIAGWSTSSRENIASHYLSALKEFGLARGAQRKASVRPAPGSASVRFLLRALQLSGVGNLAAVQSPLFRLLGLSLDETVDLLFRLSATGSLRCRIQGDVVDLDLGGPNGP